MLYKNILLIDDDTDDAEIFIEAIESLERGIASRVATNALHAFEELQTAESLPDFIFVDFNMPALNGAEFIQKMKDERRLQHIPIILMSTHSVEVMSQLTQQFETLQYMTKPSSFHELVALLDEVLCN
ncbi:response regulator [Flavobacterium piscis]|uniref:CheY-like chemotaxis protein n=1 Tax=Flavobacterium piscis TaxID=1114874 RepID=A0ABU1YBV4_9FLAO|nr:response regulator [Flavobacterium piscis]MDR7211725.1 CheY-like chemotaxis protein [Flavobacterium piscis]